jgi:hypothetical protein
VPVRADTARTVSLASSSAASKPSSTSTASSRGSDGFAHQLFDIPSRGTGSEQWRHYAVEMAVHNVLSWFFAMEHDGSHYVMQQEHDVYSGLTDTAVPAVVSDAEAADEVTRRSNALRRACEGIRVFSLTGPTADIIERPKFHSKLVTPFCGFNCFREV